MEKSEETPIDLVPKEFQELFEKMQLLKQREATSSYVHFNY